MAVPSVLLDMNMNELRKAFYSIADQPSLQILVLAGLGCLQQVSGQSSASTNKPPATLGRPLTRATGDTSTEYKFGSLPRPAPSVTSSHEGQQRRPRGHDAQTISKECYRERREEHKALRETCKELASELKLDYKASSRMRLRRLRDYTRDLQRRQAVARAAAEKTAAQNAADNAAAQAAAERKTAALEAADNAAQAAAEKKKPSPREQADNHSVGPSNMITLNSVGQTSKSPPDNEDVGIATRRNASTNSGAENEQTTSQQIAAAEKTAAAERTTGSTEKEQNPSPKPTEDRDFENNEDSGELLIMLEGLLSAEGMKNPWMLDEVGFHGGLRIWYLRTWRDFMRFDEEHIIWAAESSPHLSNHLDDCGDAMVMPGDGSGSYGEIEYAEVDGDDVAQRWLPSSGDPRHTDLRDENKFDPYYRSEGEGYKVHNHSSLDDGGPITFELCDDAQPDEDERYAWSEECNDSDGAYGVGFTSL